jgi:hypothetical protein
MAALVNAFDSGSYSEGMNASLLQIIGSLDYGDLFSSNRFNRTVEGWTPL